VQGKKLLWYLSTSQPVFDQSHQIIQLHLPVAGKISNAAQYFLFPDAVVF